LVTGVFPDQARYARLVQVHAQDRRKAAGRGTPSRVAANREVAVAHWANAEQVGTQRRRARVGVTQQRFHISGLEQPAVGEGIVVAGRLAQGTSAPLEEVVEHGMVGAWTRLAGKTSPTVVIISVDREGELNWPAAWAGEQHAPGRKPAIAVGRAV